MTEHLAVALKDHLADVVPPPGDLARVVQRGRSLRRRRHARNGVAVMAALAALWVGAMSFVPGAGERAEDQYAPVGPLDVSGGLRAYADPGVEIHLGGRVFDADELRHLDTDAIATPHGVVFYDAGRPMLLNEDGDVEALIRGSIDREPGFRPTAKIDSGSDEVAVAVLSEGQVSVTVRDLGTGEDVHSYSRTCAPCAGTVIDAYDDDVLYLRTGTSTEAVLLDTGEVVDLGRDVRIADVRNGVLLYSGVVPTPDPAGVPEWTFVEGAIDGQLTFDGRYVLAWSSRLEPTDPAGEPVVLDVGPTDGSLGFWAMDTDGSVLVAAPDETYPNYTVHDCEVSSGTCTELGPLRTTGGDPAFLGSDM